MNKKIKFTQKIFIIFTLFLILNFVNIIISQKCFAADPALISTLKKAFEKIESYIVKLSTPVAATSVGVGALMKKFSFGDEEKIRIGKKLIKGSLFSYGLILCIDMILSLINTLIG